MKQYKVKRWIGMILCGVYIFSTVSCAKKNSKTEPDSSGTTTETEYTSTEEPDMSVFTKTMDRTTGISYVSEDTPYFELRDIEQFYTYKENQYSWIINVDAKSSIAAILMEINGPSENENAPYTSGNYIFVINDQGDVIQEINVQDMVQEDPLDMLKVLIDKDGNLLLAVHIIDKNTSSSIGIRLHKFEIEEGQLIDSIELKDPEGIDKFTSYTDILKDQKGNFFVCGNRDMGIGSGHFVSVFNPDTDLLFTLNEQESGDIAWFYLERMFTDGEFVYVSVIQYDGKATRKDDPEDVVNKQYIYPIDVEGQKFGEALQGAGADMNIYDVQSGDGELYYKDNTAVYRIQPADNREIPLFFWKDIDVNFAAFEVSVAVLSDGKILIGQSLHAESDGEEPVYQWSMLERQAVNPNSGKKILHIGTYDIDWSAPLVKTAYLFNRYSKDTHAEIFDYAAADTASVPEKRFELMNQAILAGNTPDVLFEPSDMYSNNHFEQYANRGLFTDLKDRITSDDAFPTSDFYENILNASEKEGHIYYLFPYFYLRGYEAEIAITGDQRSWTIDELDIFSGEIPEHMSMFWNDAIYEDLLRDMMLTSMDEFINVTEKKAQFNTPEFQEILEFVMLNAMSAEKLSEFHEEGSWDYSIMPVFRPAMYFSAGEYLEYGDVESTVFAGVSSSGKDGVFGVPAVLAGIMRSSELQEESWVFIKYLFSEEIQDSITKFHIPVRKSSLDKRIDAEMQFLHSMSDVAGRNLEIMQSMPNLKDPMDPLDPMDGEISDDGDTLHTSAHETYDLVEIEQRREKQFRDLIASVQGIQCMNMEIWDIIGKESSAFFAGEISSQATAAIIQEQVEKLIREWS